VHLALISRVGARRRGTSGDRPKLAAKCLDSLDSVWPRCDPIQFRPATAQITRGLPAEITVTRQAINWIRILRVPP
jgi:hypothetical protein